METWNVTGGCSKVSDGCRYCWAEKLTATRFKGKSRYDGLTENGYWTGKVKLFKDRLYQPFHWHKRRHIFVCSQSDLFHEKVPFSFIGSVFNKMFLCERHAFYILTKRPLRMAEFMERNNMLYWCGFTKLPNLRIGVTVENEDAIDRINILRKIPADHRFVCFEPLLSDMPKLNLKGIEWVIIGCESGPKRRLCKLGWMLNIVEQCQEAGTKIYVKQIETGCTIKGRYRTRVEHNVRYFLSALKIREKIA